MVTAAADRFDLVHDARYAWPLLAVGARACAAPATVRGPAAAERAGDLLGRLRTLAAKMDAWGPVQLAGRLTFAAEAGPSSRMRPRRPAWRTAGPWRNGTRWQRPGGTLPSPIRSPWR